MLMEIGLSDENLEPTVRKVARRPLVGLACDALMVISILEISLALDLFMKVNAEC